MWFLSWKWGLEGSGAVIEGSEAVVRKPGAVVRTAPVVFEAEMRIGVRYSLKMAVEICRTDARGGWWRQSTTASGVLMPVAE